MKKAFDISGRIILIAVVVAVVFSVGHFRGPRFPKQAHAMVTDFQPWPAGSDGMYAASGVPGAVLLTPKNLEVNGMPVLVGGGLLERAVVGDVLNYYQTRYALYKDQSIYFIKGPFGIYSVIRSDLESLACEEPCEIQFDDTLFGVMAYRMPGTDTVHYFTIETRKGFSFNGLLEQADDRWEVPDPRGVPRMPNGVREMIIKGDEAGQDMWTIIYTNPGTVKMSEVFYRVGFKSRGWRPDRLMEDAQSRVGLSSSDAMLYFRRDRESCFVRLSPEKYDDEDEGERTSAVMVYTRKY